MQVSNVLAGYANQAASATSKAANAVASTTSSLSALAGTTNTAAKEVLSQYDLKSISPDQFSEMLGKLRKAGALSDKDYEDLSQVRAELDKDGYKADQKTNLVDYCNQKVQKLKESGGGTTDNVTLASAQRHAEWVTNCATIQSTAGQSALNLAA